MAPVLFGFSLAALVTLGSAWGNSLEEVFNVSQAEARVHLLTELAATTGQTRELESVMRPMFVSLPKDEDGLLSNEATFYALHRLLLKKFGWFVKGLEPSTSGAGPAQSREWVPGYLLEVLKERNGGRGLDLRGLAAMASTIEVIAGKSAERLVEAIYGIVGDDTPAETVFDLYLMSYVSMSGLTTIETREEALDRLEYMPTNYPAWKEVQAWAQQLWAEHKSTASKDEKSAVKAAAKALGKRFGEFNDIECRQLKTTLMGIESTRQARVLLSSFYKTALVSHWEFSEKIDYLRALGALDESDASRPAVIIPNYVASRPQCLESDLYAVCCGNECESLLGRLEERLAAERAAPSQILALVEELSTDTVASRALPEALRNRLTQVAEANGGLVPIHGRLFAQWMHHAFPRECPFPHEAGTTAPLTSAEWMRETGSEKSTATEEEMVCHVSGPCAGGDAAAQAQDAAAKAAFSDELPWSDAEELIVDFGGPRAGGSMSWKDAAVSWQDRLNKFLHSVILFASALGVGIASKNAVPQPGSDFALKGRVDARRWRSALSLLLLPLAVVSLDYVFDLATSTELVVCVLCWAVAGMIAKQWPACRKGQAGHFYEPYAKCV